MICSPARIGILGVKAKLVDVSSPARGSVNESTWLRVEVGVGGQVSGVGVKGSGCGVQGVGCRV